MKIFKFTLALISIFYFNLNLMAQEKSKLIYRDAKQFYLYGKAKPSSNFYHRVDTSTYSNLSSTIKNLLTNSAGLAICFKTNSKTISAKWCVTTKKAMSNMTPIAQKGLDLYIKRDGKWQFAGVGKPTKECSEDIIVTKMDDSEKECMLFLPLYDELKNLEIGTEEGSIISSLENPFHHKIIIYGSSIVQGASAGRPGMAYPAILSRNTGLYFINLGISGNAKMEPEAARMVSDMTADAFILDCIPNPSPAQIKARTEDFISALRNKHPKTPIILIQTVIREVGNFNLDWKKRVEEQNLEASAAFNRLKAKGMNDIYMITSEKLLGDDHDATTDGTHPNDLGFYRMAQQLETQITNILKQYNIK